MRPVPPLPPGKLQRAAACPVGGGSTDTRKREGIGAIRSKIGDAHGQGKKQVRPAPRHAELVVNLAGSMATFMAATWEQAKKTPS
jgi:hypothetical protein